jgi:large subunit ribosomal protein L4e
MKANILDIEGKKTKEIVLPSCFSAKIREDVVTKALETKKTKQPYGPSLVAGKQVSAKGKIRHRRHVWQTHYGRGMSRIPRKVMSRRGTQFNWEGAEVPQAKGGMRAHPPKAISMINTKRINKKELKVALASAISATASEKFLGKKYSSLKDIKIKELPFIVESKLITLKTKEILQAIKNILGEKIFKIASKTKTQRAGKGKLRGRKYKQSAGLLMVLGEKEKLKINAFDVINVKKLGINELAKGGLGRLTIYTEKAIKNLEDKK